MRGPRSYLHTFATVGGSVRFILDDGTALDVPAPDVRRLYELLWQLSEERGAVSTAAVLIGASRGSASPRTHVELTSPQSAVLREAVAMLHSTE